MPSGFDGPLLVLGWEWAAGNLRGVRSCGIWLHEDDTSLIDDPEFKKIWGDIDNQDFLAGLIANGRLRRIGSMPPVGRYAEPPAWLT
jgi:hypothetical protein